MAPTFGTTARYALRWLLGSNVISDIDAGFQALAEDAEATFAGRSSGPLSSRPVSTPTTPGIDGRFYRATDTGQVFLDTGVGWVELTLGGPVQTWTAGDIKLAGSAATPTGWLACDGAAVDRTTYAALFAAIGTAHGAGNGTSTFNVPDLRGRAPVGAGQGTGLTSRALGSKFGEEAHALTGVENGPHTHPHDIGGATTVPNSSLAHSHNGATLVQNEDLTHAHGFNGNVPVAISGRSWAEQVFWFVQGAGNPTGVIPLIVAPSSSQLANALQTAGSASLAHTHNFSTQASASLSHTHNLALTGGVQSAGGGQAHNNVPPSVGVSYVIKT